MDGTGEINPAENKRKAKLRRMGLGYPYLTKRILVRAARNAGDRGARQAMENLGYVIIARNGMLVRLNKDGTEVQIRKLVSHRTRQVEP